MFTFVYSESYQLILTIRRNMKIREIIAPLEEIAPLEYQEEYDNSGLLLGSYDDEITGVLLCLDVTDKVLDEARNKNCNLIIAHHPLIFRGLKRLTGSGNTEKLVMKAIKLGLSVYAIHTNLDNSLCGINTHLATLLGLKKQRILSP